MNEVSNFCNGECQNVVIMEDYWKKFTHEILTKHGSSMFQKWKTW